MTETKATSGGWKTWALVGSVGLNLLILGAVVGTLATHKGGSKQADFTGIGALGPMTRALPEAQREELRSSFRSQRKAFGKNRKAVDAVGKEILDAIAADPFDPERLNAAFAARHAVLGQIATKSQGVFVELVSGMTAAERAEFVENVKAMPRRKKVDRHKHIDKDK